jgi:hypothetical protein
MSKFRYARIASCFVASLAFAACGPVGAGGPGDSGGSGGVTGGGGHVGGGGSGGANQGDCNDAAKLVYTVDTNGTFSSFNPANMQFHDLGQLSCPNVGTCTDATGSTTTATPFSMSIDRNATAWVLYCSGKVFKVDTSSLSCEATSFQTNQMGFNVFGMGFAADQSMSTAETLYIAGGGLADLGLGGSSQMGTIAFPALTVSQVGSVNGWPELTGTGDAQLWGFFPSDALGFSAPHVGQIDKTSGNEMQSFDLPTLSGPPAAWAFAFWGDGFWIFLKTQSDSATKVYHVLRSNGQLAGSPLPTSGRTIVGAGVSTCAPIVGIHR